MTKLLSRQSALNLQKASSAVRSLADPLRKQPFTVHRRMTTTQASQLEIVSTEKAPAAVGPYSQAIKTSATQIVFLSGQVGLVPGTKDLAGNDVESQAEQALKNLGAVLDAAGSSFSNVTKTTVLLTSMSDFATVNKVYSKYLPDKPARACYAVKELPLGAKVEIEAVAIADQKSKL